ncbi:hypothetical protein ACN47E_002848 [Coniothyrium glycines]
MALPDRILHHPSLQCSLRGSPSACTTQFRNLKYASIPARYKNAIPNDTLQSASETIVDATRFGPSCPQKRGAQAWDVTLVGNVQLRSEPGQCDTEPMDEFECLHLSVTVPRSADDMTGPQPEKPLPVFVWVHGGGLSMGSNNWPQYDLRKLVERSVKIGKPIVGVAINYRLNVFGFLASEEIGAAGNMGFKDQVLAFRWIKKHIQGFGGDPNNITAVGESAGGISLSTLLSANIGHDGLFNRVVVMSGDTTLRKPRRQIWHQKMYRDQSNHLGVKEDVAKRMLLETGAEELAQKLPLAQHFAGLIEDEWLEHDVTLETMLDRRSIHHKPTWCAEFVVGDTALDGTVLKSRVLDHPQALDRLLSACAIRLSTSETQKLLAAYHLDEAEPSQIETADHLRELLSELRFYLPVLAAYQGWKSLQPAQRAGRYHFHIPNPFDGDFKGIASHELDVAYLLGNFQDHLDEHNQKLAHAMADKFIGFANAEGWANNGKIIVFGSNGVEEVDEAVYDLNYRDGRGRVLQAIGAQKLWHLAETWQGVREEESSEADETDKSML